MDKEELLFYKIFEKLSADYDNVAIGKMMSFPAIQYKKKVFAFYHNKQLVFKLGKEFDPINEGIKEFSFLSPFKNKPPLAGWFYIPAIYNKKWFNLAKQALKLLQNEIK